MKRLVLGLLAAAVFMPLISGCATPQYTGGWPTIRLPDEKWTGENANNVLRVWVLENRMMIEDIHQVFLVDAPSSLTKWHIR